MLESEDVVIAWNLRVQLTVKFMCRRPMEAELPSIACGEEQKPGFSKYLRRMGFELNEHWQSRRQRVTIFNKQESSETGQTQRKTTTKNEVLGTYKEKVGNGKH